MTIIEREKSCCNCNSDGIKHIWGLTDKKRQQLLDYDQAFYDGLLARVFTDEEYQFTQCDNCSHYQYLHNIAEDKLNKLYTTHSEIRKKQKKQNDFDAQVRKQRHLIEPILLSLKSKSNLNARLLDYGSGAGVWSKIAADCGFQVTSFEPYALRSYIHDELESDWNAIKGRKFDVIICNQVLEHVGDPQLLARRFEEVSDDNTLLYCAVPNAGKVKQKHFIETWPYDRKTSHTLAPFQHLSGFTQKSLAKPLSNHGFKLRVRDNFSANLKSAGKVLAILTFGVIPQISTTSGIFCRKK